MTCSGVCWSPSVVCLKVVKQFVLAVHRSCRLFVVLPIRCPIRTIVELYRAFVAVVRLAKRDLFDSRLSGVCEVLIRLEKLVKLSVMPSDFSVNLNIHFNNYRLNIRRLVDYFITMSIIDDLVIFFLSLYFCPWLVLSGEPRLPNLVILSSICWLICYGLHGVMKFHL